MRIMWSSTESKTEVQSVQKKMGRAEAEANSLTTGSFDNLLPTITLSKQMATYLSLMRTC